MNARERLVGASICYPTGVSAAYDLERALVGIQAAGLSRVELFSLPGICEHIDLERASDSVARAVRLLLERHGLTAAALSIGTDLTTDAGAERFGRAAAMAERLGVRIVVANVQSASTPETERAFFERVGAIAASARRHQVVLALETHGGLVCTAADGAALVDRIGSEHVKLAYDMANVVKYGRRLPESDLRDQFARIADTVAHVHLKDRADFTERYDFPPFGEGILDFAAVLDLLHQGGYRGWLTVEATLDGRPTSANAADAALARSVAYLDGLWNEDDAP